jgi:hypothetical protein
MGFAAARPLGPVLDLFARDQAARLELLRAVWPAAVGPPLARVSRVESLHNDQLRVRVPDGRWRLVLHRMQGRILGRLGEAVGGLAPRRLGFLEGLVVESARQEAAAPPPQEPPPGLRKAAAVIADEELRTAFLETASRYLARFGGALTPPGAGEAVAAARPPRPGDPGA